jgi:hypothetical protein
MMKLFHTTDAADSIFASGFRDATGAYGFVEIILTGVFLSRSPADVSDGAKGESVIEVSFEEDVDLDPYAIIEEAHPVWEWCVPAALINSRAQLRLLDEDEIGPQAEKSSWDRFMVMDHHPYPS